MDKKTTIRSARNTMGFFTNEQTATQALQHITDLFQGDQSRVSLINPNDPHIETKLKDEYSVMGQAAIAVHIWSVVLSVAAGVAFWAVFYQLGWPVFVHEATTALLGSVCVFLLIGILIGCLVAYRPGRNGVIHPAREAAAKGKWILIAYPNSTSELEATTRYLQEIKLKTT